MCCLFLQFHSSFFPHHVMIGTIQLVYSETGFFHLTVHFFLTHSIAGIRCGFFIVQLYFIVWVYYNLFIHPPVKWHLNSLVFSGFWWLWINPLYWGFCVKVYFHSSWVNSQGWNYWLIYECMFTFIESVKLLSNMTVPFCISMSTAWEFRLFLTHVSTWCCHFDFF